MSLFLRNIKYLFTVRLKDLSNAAKTGGLVSREELDALMDNLPYELHDDIRHLTIPKIKTISETIADLTAARVSLCRFGDGELWLMEGRDIPLQKASAGLAERLKEVLSSRRDDIGIAIPRVLYASKHGLADASKKFWRKYGAEFRKQIERHIDFERMYYAAESTLAYSFYTEYDFQGYFDSLRKIWQGKDVSIICGSTVFEAIAHNIFDNCCDLEYQHAPSVNAFEQYDDILAKARDLDKDRLIIAILGPTAKVLAHDLGLLGRRCLDLGHTAKSYDWFIKGKKIHTKAAVTEFFKPD